MKKIAIAGYGVLGQALAEILGDVIIYDPPKELGNKEELNKAEIIFICVPTPYKGKCDISYVENIFEILEGEKIVVIKSTVIPGTTEALQKKYPQHKVMFNPEFLTEKNSKKDMKKPDRQIIGCTGESCYLSEDILELLPKAPYERVIPATEAEMIKYFTNSFLALKVGFANQIYDLCQEMGIDYVLVQDGVIADKRIGKTHFDIFTDDERGYSGKCFPKDVKSLLRLSEELKVNFSILEAVNKYNDNINADARKLENEN